MLFYETLFSLWELQLFLSILYVSSVMSYLSMDLVPPSNYSAAISTEVILQPQPAAMSQAEFERMHRVSRSNKD